MSNKHYQERRKISRSPARRVKRFGAAGFEVLETRIQPAALPLITEVMASNDETLLDEDGSSSDWIEIANVGDATLDLAGWHLTDDPTDLEMWTFPAVTLDPGQFLIVFASDKDRADADGTELHTNFKLSAAGDYLGLVEPDGSTIAFEYARGHSGTPVRRQLWSDYALIDHRFGRRHDHAHVSDSFGRLARNHLDASKLR